MRFNSIDTRILEVCERSECTAGQCFWSRGCKEVQMRLSSIGTRILEVCERSKCVADQCFG